MTKSYDDHPEWVVIEGGVAQYQSDTVVVLDLDELDGDGMVTNDQIDNVRVLHEKATQIGLQDVVERCEDWLDEAVGGWYVIDVLNPQSARLYGPFDTEEEAVKERNAMYGSDRKQMYVTRAEEVAR